MMEWQWHQLDHMQITCTSVHTGITMPIPYHSVFTGRMPFLPPNKQCRSTEGMPIPVTNSSNNTRNRYGSFHLWINVWMAGKTV